MTQKSKKDAVVLEKPKKPTVKVWRAALYIRLSVELNGKRGDSLEIQRQIMEAYITLCPDIEIVGVYTDNGITGRTFEREAFQRMLHDVEDGKVDCIVVKGLSRLGRNTIDTGYYIEKYFPLHGVRFIAVNDQFDSEDSENSGNHLIVPLNEVVKRLNAGGVMTPGYYLAHIGLITSQQLMGSGKWQTWTVGKILDSEVYTGDLVQGKHTNVGHQQILTKPEDWIVVRNTHEPIISREIFVQAQAAREKAAKRGKPRTAKVPYTENILRGRVFCGCCGKNLHRQRHQCGYYFYHCISNDRIGKGACNAKVYVRENDLFTTIVTIIRQKAEIVMGETMRLKQYNGRIAAQKIRVDQEINELARQTQKNRAIRAGLHESFVKGILTRAEYLEMQADYNQKVSGAIERVQ